MAFPSNPTNGDTYSLGGVTYTFNSSTSQWIGALPASSGGGGSMGAPTHFGRFTINAYFNDTEHAGGSINGYIGQDATLATNTLDIVSKTNGNLTLSTDAANYGTSIVAGGSIPDYSGLMDHFANDADYLASNPTYTSNSGSYWNTTLNSVRYTNDSGATFNTFTPQMQSNGKIKLVTPGKYKIKIVHYCDIAGGVASYSSPIIHTLVFVDGDIKVNYPAKSTWEFRSNNSANGLDNKLHTEFDTYLETTAANTEFSVGLNKLGNNITSTNTFIITVESAF